MQKTHIYQPIKKAYEVYPANNFAEHSRYSKEEQLFVYRYPIAIIFVQKDKSLQLIYFNLRTARVLQQRIIPVTFHEYISPSPILIRQKNECFILMLTENNFLSLLSLKTLSITFQWKLPDSPWVRFCYMNDHIIIWEYNSKEVTFWRLFQEKSVGDLSLPGLVNESHVQLNNRNMLILQTQQYESLILIDVVTKSVLKKIDTKAHRLITAVNTESFIYILDDMEMQGVSFCKMYNYHFDEGLELRDERIYSYSGYCPWFVSLDGGRLVSLTDVRKAFFIDFEKEKPVEKFISRGDEFDARRFINYSDKNLVVTVTRENALWIWKY